jgi:hypothetical protein
MTSPSKTGKHNFTLEIFVFTLLCSVPNSRWLSKKTALVKQTPESLCMSVNNDTFHTSSYKYWANEVLVTSLIPTLVKEV